MSCVAKEVLYAYAEKELSPEEGQKVSAHLNTCSRCRGELLLIRQIDEVLAEEALQEPPPDFTRSVMGRVPLRSKWMETGWYYMIWAALVAMGITLLLWTDWDAQLDRASGHLWVWMEHRIEEVLTSMAAGRDGVAHAFTEWTGTWAQWIGERWQETRPVGEFTWFLPVTLISLCSLALYHLLDALYEDRRPRALGSW